MKLVFLEGMPTSGKTVLGRKIVDFLHNELDKNKFEVFYFNDDVRNKFNIDILHVLKNQDKIELNKNNVKKHLETTIRFLEKIEKEKQKECIFVIDRFYFSYLPYLDCSFSYFQDIEKNINKFTFFVLLGFKGYDREKIFQRFKNSLYLRKNHSFEKHFRRIVSDRNKGKDEKERTYNHYYKRNKIYNKAFKKSKLKNKFFFGVDRTINKEDYNSLLYSLEKPLIGFVLK